LLYPSTIDTNMKRQGTKRFMDGFCQTMQDKADEISEGAMRVFPFSRIFDAFNSEYMDVFNRMKYSFVNQGRDLPESPYLNLKRFRNELSELLKHTGVEDMTPGIVELGIRIVSSYAAEEWVIRKFLANEEWFRNPVAVSNEAMFTFPVLANAYLGVKNRGPWLFVLYEGERK